MIMSEKCLKGDLISDRSCSGCGQPITDQYILRVAPDLEWHSRCLRCCQCESLLHEMSTCFVKEGKIFCKVDYLKLYGARCWGCKRGFYGNDLVMRARDRAYHVECFRCSSCGKHLVPGDEYALDEVRGLLCRTDHECLKVRHGPMNALQKMSWNSEHDVEVFRINNRDPSASTNQNSGNKLTPPTDVAGKEGKQSKDGSTNIAKEDTNDLNNNDNINNEEDRTDAYEKEENDDDDDDNSCHKHNKDQDKHIVNKKKTRHHAILPLAHHSSSHHHHHQHHHPHHPHHLHEGGGQRSQPHKTTRVRTVLNERQLHTLRTCYGANPRPDALMKEQLVEMTGLSPRVIRVWFQNKRCKDKKKTIMMKQLQQQHLGQSGDSNSACSMDDTWASHKTSSSSSSSPPPLFTGSDHDNHHHHHHHQQHHHRLHHPHTPQRQQRHQHNPAKSGSTWEFPYIPENPEGAMLKPEAASGTDHVENFHHVVDDVVTRNMTADLREEDGDDDAML